jgi:hypothetical protein
MAEQINPETICSAWMKERNSLQRESSARRSSRRRRVIREEPESPQLFDGVEHIA